MKALLAKELSPKTVVNEEATRERGCARRRDREQPRRRR